MQELSISINIEISPYVTNRHVSYLVTNTYVSLDTPTLTDRLVFYRDINNGIIITQQQ